MSAPLAPTAAATVVQSTAAAYKGVEDALETARTSLVTLTALTEKSALPAVAGVLTPWPKLTGRTHLAKLNRAMGAIGEATELVIAAHVEINAWRAKAKLPEVIVPTDAGGGK